MKLVVYRPNLDIVKGGAFQFSFSHNRRKVPTLFIEAAPQVKAKPAPGSKESPFNWDVKSTIKVDINEIGDILATLRNRKSETKLYHKYESRVSEFKLVPGQEGSYSVALHSKEGEQTKSVKIFISASEAELLAELCVFIIHNYYQHDHRSIRTEQNLVAATEIEVSNGL